MQVDKHDGLAGKPLLRRLPWLPKARSPGKGSAPGTLTGTGVSTFGWMDTVHIYRLLGCSSAQAAAVGVAEVALRMVAGEELCSSGEPRALSAAVVLMLRCCFLCLSFSVFPECVNKGGFVTAQLRPGSPRAWLPSSGRGSTKDAVDGAMAQQRGLCPIAGLKMGQLFNPAPARG